MRKSICIRSFEIFIAMIVQIVVFYVSGSQPSSDCNPINSFPIRWGPGIIDARARYQAVAQRLRNTVLGSVVLQVHTNISEEHASWISELKVKEAYFSTIS
jgi:hypothetical protein